MRYPLNAPNGYRINGGAWTPSPTPQQDAAAEIATSPDGVYTVEWRCETQHPAEGRFTVQKPEPIEPEQPIE